MKKLIAEVRKDTNGVLHCFMYRNDADVDAAFVVRQTLLEFIEQSIPDDQTLEALVTQAEAGRYVSPNTDLPDWGVNDINIWLAPPMAKPGYVCITNENTEYSSDEQHGNPQHFTYAQFHAALKHWREFQELIGQRGKENLLGQRFEAPWPEA